MQWVVETFSIADDETEKYYYNNWEKIEDEILEKFSRGNF